MPRYDFACDDCGLEQEVTFSFEEIEGAQVFCHGCKRQMRQRYATWVVRGPTSSTRLGPKERADMKVAMGYEPKTVADIDEWCVRAGKKFNKGTPLYKLGSASKASERG